LQKQNHPDCNRPLADASLAACLDCDLLQRIPEVPPGASVRCVRCDKELWRHKPDSLNRTFALTVAALVLYLIANCVPMLGLNAVGREAFTTVVGGAQQLWLNGQQIVAGLVLFAAVISPALQIGFLLLIVLGCQRERPPAWTGLLLRHLHFTRTWSMIEVMLLGVLVALTKIADYAHVILGTALFALFALVVLLAAIQSTFDPREVWQRVKWAEEEVRPVTGSKSGESSAMNATAPTALAQGLQSCHGCGLLSRPASDASDGRCPRCDEELVFRKSDSLQRTLAYLVGAAVCYVPANLLPVLTTVTAGTRESDTIMQGVVLLWSPTGWPLSLIVLFASIMIPSAKIVALGYLLFTVKRGSIQNNVQRVRLYRMVEIIGRWSMVDVFVDTFTVSLIQLQPLMSVEPGPGLLFFAAVVVLTMLAVESFDPRLIWDSDAVKATPKEVQHA
jgi:paraquat-inducible protein A